MAGAGKTTVLIKAFVILIRLINGEPGCHIRDKLLVLWTAQSHPPLDSASKAVRKLTKGMPKELRRTFCRFLKKGSSGTRPIDVQTQDRKNTVREADLIIITAGGLTADAKHWPQLRGHEGKWGIHVHDEAQQYGQVHDLVATAATKGGAHMVQIGDP